ncbi:MAG: hypothetical protein WD468_03330 [Pirellulales bacterium]
MANSVEGFQNSVREAISLAPPFEAAPYYDPDIDALFFYARSVRSYAKRLNATITVFLSMDDDSLVGVKIKGVKRILRRVESLQDTMKMVLIDSSIKLGIFVQFALATPPDDPALDEYERQLEQYKDVPVRTTELSPALAT